jgi:protein subunit release factor B
MTNKQLLFSVTKKDMIRQTFRCGGNGGQNVNKVETGVRFIHTPSGARGESCTHRKQHANEVEAFDRLAKSKEFQKWMRTEIARRMNNPVQKTEKEILEEVNEKVNMMMEPYNLLIEEF